MPAKAECVDANQGQLKKLNKVFHCANQGLSNSRERSQTADQLNSTFNFSLNICKRMYASSRSTLNSVLVPWDDRITINLGGHMDAILPLQSTPRRSRRKHSSEFKAAVLAACHQSGVSVAAIALVVVVEHTKCAVLQPPC